MTIGQAHMDGGSCCAKTWSLSSVQKAYVSLALALVLSSAGVTAASARTASDEATAKDPYEKLNRFIFFGNGMADFLVIRPLSITFKRVMPRPIRNGLHNGFTNMGEPVVIINEIFQGHGKKAVRTTLRFAENSTVGVAGLFDVASTNGLPHHDTDFGITLAHYGVKSGPYLVLPVLGPGTVRDGVGALVNIGIDPFTWSRFPQSEAVGYGRAIGNGLDQRAAADKDIKRIEATSTDIYASIRSYYLQNREAQITGGRLDVNALPSFDEAPTAPPSDAPAKALPTPPSS
jgi:phospholipid-binding lipoprotein MlaA